MPLSGIYDLSIRIFPDGFSFVASEGGKVLICSTERGLGRSDVISLLRQEMQRLRIQATDFRKNKLIVHAPVSTLVPDALYRPSDAQTWLRFFQTDIKEYNVVHEDKLLPFGCVNVYALSGGMSAFVRSCSGFEVRHCLSHLLLESVLPFRQQEQSAVFLYAGPSMIDVAVLECGQLVLANSFRYTANSDVLYHLLNLYERFHLPPERTKCYLNSLENGQEMKGLLEQYIDVKTI